MDSIYRMAAFVALELADILSLIYARDWLAGVYREPKKWQKEADAFDALCVGFTTEQAARAIAGMLVPQEGK